MTRIITSILVLFLNVTPIAAQTAPSIMHLPSIDKFFVHRHVVLWKTSYAYEVWLTEDSSPIQYAVSFRGAASLPTGSYTLHVLGMKNMEACVSFKISQ